MKGAETTWATRTFVQDGVPESRAIRGFLLEVTTGRGSPQPYPFAAEVVRVGSRPGADLVISDELVSRLHFEIVLDAHGFRLRDLGSRNGTWVDGYRAQDIYLRLGSTIRAGDTTFLFTPTDAESRVPRSEHSSFAGAVGKSLAMRELFALLDKAAQSDATLLFEGESGTGKEVLTRAVHRSSKRAQGPFVVVDCGAVPANLLESLLFGHEKGAFTGATERRVGQCEAADGGTLFLDEIGELPIELQPKLLRLLEDRTFRRVGGTDAVSFDARIVAATNRDLAEAVNRGVFREDLYYRLAVIRVRVPPLRERREDIRMLVEHFVRRRVDDVAEADRVLASITGENWKRLETHPWPGNVRELRNVIERSLALGARDLEVESGPANAVGTAGWDVDLERPYGEQKAELLSRFDRAYLEGQLERHGGNISRAARAAGMERMHYKRMLKKLD